MENILWKNIDNRPKKFWATISLLYRRLTEFCQWLTEFGPLQWQAFRFRLYFLNEFCPALLRLVWLMFTDRSCEYGLSQCRPNEECATQPGSKSRNGVCTCKGGSLKDQYGMCVGGGSADPEGKSEHLKFCSWVQPNTETQCVKNRSNLNRQY